MHASVTSSKGIWLQILLDHCWIFICSVLRWSSFTLSAFFNATTWKPNSVNATTSALFQDIVLWHEECQLQTWKVWTAGVCVNPTLRTIIFWGSSFSAKQAFPRRNRGKALYLRKQPKQLDDSFFTVSKTVAWASNPTEAKPCINVKERHQHVSWPFPIVTSPTGILGTSFTFTREASVGWSETSFGSDSSCEASLCPCIQLRFFGSEGVFSLPGREMLSSKIIMSCSRIDGSWLSHLTGIIGVGFMKETLSHFPDVTVILFFPSSEWN